MLEVRYKTDTKELTGWCGDESQFGNLYRGRPSEAIVILSIPIPEKSCEAYLYDDATQSLIDNPDYTEPEPSSGNYVHPGFTRVSGNTAVKLGVIEDFLETL